MSNSPSLFLIALLALPSLGLAQVGLYHDSCGCTFHLGGGFAPVAGKDGSSLDTGWKSFQAGGGFALTPSPKTDHSVSIYVVPNFLFDESSIKQAALQNTKALNLQNTGILQATDGRGRFVNVTLDLSARFPFKRGEFYVLGGFGFLRRTLELTGSSSIGTLLQPGNPVVFSTHSNSGAFDAGGGLNFKLPRGPFAVYAEAKVLHGLAINGGTTLFPISFGVRF